MSTNIALTNESAQVNVFTGQGGQAARQEVKSWKRRLLT
jgi:hypothetical protein